MKILVLFISMVCFFTTGHGQYIAGETWVGPKGLRDLVKQLQNKLPDAQKAGILLRIGYGHLYKAGENKADLDSALRYAQEARALGTQIHHDSLTNESLLLTSMVYMEQKNMPAAKSLLPALHDSNRIKMMICLSKFDYYTKPSTADDHALLDSAAYYMRAAVKLASNNTKWRTMALEWLEVIGRRYSSRHLRAKAEEQFLFMQEHSDSSGFPSRARTLSNLSKVYSDEGNFYKATNYSISAEKALNSRSSVSDIAFVNLHLGSLYTTQEKYEQAQLYWGKLLADPIKYRPEVAIYGVANNYCNNLRKLHRTDEIMPFVQKFKQQCPIEERVDNIFYHLMLGNAYKDLHQFVPAEKNYLESIKQCDTAVYAPGMVYYNLGSLYQEMNDHDRALAAFKIAEKGLPTEVMEASNLSSISQSEAALGNYRAAYDHLVKSKGITDSIFVESKAKVTQELEVQYETGKKEAALQAAMEQARVRKTVTIIIIGLLGVIIGLLVWLFWTKLRSNKVITGKNVQLQQLVKDKSWLLKEMHHRVKNNLHTIMNLLEFQSVYLHDDALDAIRNSQSRIFSMSLIHQKLYQTDEDTKTIDMAVYIPELLSYLRECFPMHGNCHINMDLEETMIFYVEEAVPLGLIINEAVTNSMKYAFAAGGTGEITIGMKASGVDEYELILADNGKGLGEHFDLDNVTSLGFQLIKGLSEQLGAELHLINEGGLKILLSGISVYRTSKVKTMEQELKEQMRM